MTPLKHDVYQSKQLEPYGLLLPLANVGMRIQKNTQTCMHASTLFGKQLKYTRFASG